MLSQHKTATATGCDIQQIAEILRLIKLAGLNINEDEFIALLEKQFVYQIYEVVGELSQLPQDKVNLCQGYNLDSLLTIYEIIVCHREKNLLTPFIQESMVDILKNSWVLFAFTKKLFFSFSSENLLSAQVINEFFKAPFSYLNIYAVFEGRPGQNEMMFILLLQNLTLEKTQMLARILDAPIERDQFMQPADDFLYINRPWLTPATFTLMLSKLEHCESVVPLFLRRCLDRNFYQQHERHADIRDILHTLFCMQEAGVRLDKHNAKIAFAKPSLGDAYQFCVLTGCLQHGNHSLQMSPLDVIRHLSLEDELMNALVELAKIHDSPREATRVHTQKQIRQLFACTFEEPVTTSFCCGLFKRQVVPQTIAEVMEVIRAEYQSGLDFPLR